MYESFIKLILYFYFKVTTNRKVACIIQKISLLNPLKATATLLIYKYFNFYILHKYYLISDIVTLKIRKLYYYLQS